MRSSHGSSREDSGPPIIPSGNDVQAGGEDFNGKSIIGEACPCITDIRSGDGECKLGAGRRVLARIIVIVSGGYDDGDAAVVKLKMESLVSGVAVAFHPLGTYRFNGLVHAVKKTTSQAHRSNRGSARVQCFPGDPEYAGDTVGRCRESATISGKRETKKAYTSDHVPLPASLRTFTAITLEALATPYGRETAVPAQ